MGVWSKIGKGLLTAAPYIAAPFTGGMSLYAAPAAKMAVDKWNQHDAEKNMARGLAPSRTDQLFNMASDIYGGTGGFGKGGGGSYIGNDVGNSSNRIFKNQPSYGGGFGQYGSPSIVGERGGGWQDMIGGISGAIGNIVNNRQQQPQQYGQQSQQPNYGMGMQPSYGMDQTNPNLATSIEAGRRAAMGPSYSPIPYSPVARRNGEDQMWTARY